MKCRSVVLGGGDRKLSNQLGGDIGSVREQYLTSLFMIINPSLVLPAQFSRVMQVFLLLSVQLAALCSAQILKGGTQKI